MNEYNYTDDCNLNGFCVRDQNCPMYPHCMKKEETTELVYEKPSAIFLVPNELISDTDVEEFRERLGKVLSGEIQLETKPAKEPSCHRCFFCWLVSKLPKHYRCEHGRLVCEQCEVEEMAW